MDNITDWGVEAYVDRALGGFLIPHRNQVGEWIHQDRVYQLVVHPEHQVAYIVLTKSSSTV